MVYGTVALSPRRQRRRDARIERIVDAALDLVGEGGLEALTIQRLADRLDYTVGALYRYFASKDALLTELERRVIVAFHGVLSAAMTEAEEHARAACPDTPESVLALVRIAAVARRYAMLAHDEPARFRLASLMLSEPRELLPEAEGLRVMEALQPLLGEVRDTIERATTAGALADGDATDRTLVLWSGLQGALQLSKLARFEPGRLGAHTLVDNLVHTLLAGWGADETTLTAAEASARRALPRRDLD